MSCKPASPAVSVAHIEVFAVNHVVVIPAGIGFAPPLRRHGAYVRSGRCAYPMRTVEPTGLVLLAAGATPELGHIFDLWGQRLSEREVAGFHATHSQHVSVFLDGVRWRGNPRSLAIAPDAQITVEVGPFVPPHTRYAFPPPPSVEGR